jgi:hypothetical protein
MLDRCDRLQVAVNDAAATARRFAQLLGAETTRQDASRHLAAQRTVLAMGESEIELCQPDGAGRTQDFLAARGEGLMTAGYSTPDIGALERRLQGLGAPYALDGEQLYIGPPATPGLPMVISPSVVRPRVGPVSFLYETTNTLRSDWRVAATLYAGLFGLDPSRFSAIGSKRFGYEGTLTLFAPPDRLDRIELSQATDPNFAMGRFVQKHGDSLYMAYVETHDWPSLRDRILAAGARYTPRGADPATERDGGWVHPRELHGLLLGMSRTSVAWEWSGRPELVKAA